MTAQEFIDWIQTSQNLPNLTHAVKKAAQMMRVTEGIVWKWLNTKKPSPTPEYMKLLMDLLHEKYKGRKPPIHLSQEQRKKMQSMLGNFPDKQIAAEFRISHFTVQDERYKLGIKKYNTNAGKRIPEYSKEFIAALGTDTDINVAEKFGYANSSIARIRSKFGIAPYKGPRKTTKQYDKKLINMLGKVPDSEIAKKFNYSCAAIAFIRKKMGIPSFRENKLSQKQYEEMRFMFGKMTDKELAEKFGTTQKFVNKLRKQSGIKVFDPYSEQKKLILSLLGKESDYAIAKKINCSVSMVRYIRNKHGIKPIPRSFIARLSPEKREELLSKLGKDYDKNIAEQFGVDAQTISKIRIQMDIAQYSGTPEEIMERNKTLIPLLGTLPDEILAAQTGLTKQVIGNMRRKLNIPAFGGRGRPMKNSTSKHATRN